jgi:alpha-D-ribose 1-methylphosphonate 5-triphosphate synthase subunit PhnH
MLSGGFGDVSSQSARAFRAVMEAMARPGTLHTVAGARPPLPLSGAAGVLILTLCDGTTPVYLAPAFDLAEVRTWITFHTGAPFVAAEAASFAIGDWAGLTPVSRFAIGTPEYPDRSATLIVEMGALTATGHRLTGPGIESHAALSLPDLAPFRANRALFPQGFDTYLTCGAQLAALPRSTIVESL